VNSDWVLKDPEITQTNGMSISTTTKVMKT